MLGIYNQNLNANYMNGYTGATALQNYGQFNNYSSVMNPYQQQSSIFGNYAACQQPQTNDMTSVFMALLSAILPAILGQATNQQQTQPNNQTHNHNHNQNQTQNPQNMMLQFLKKLLPALLGKKAKTETTDTTAANTTTTTGTTTTTAADKKKADILELFKNFHPIININNYGNIGSINLGNGFGKVITHGAPSQTVIKDENIVKAA